jgi:hypothetical protein
MNQKHVTLAACLLAFGLAAQAQNGGISPDMLKKIQNSYQNTAAEAMLTAFQELEKGVDQGEILKNLLASSLEGAAKNLRDE